MSGDLGPESCLIANGSLPLPSLSWGLPRITAKGSGELLGQATLRAQRENGNERILETKELGPVALLIAYHRKE